jgi:hypothetical protein
MAQDLLGRPATQDEAAELEKAAEAIHVANLSLLDRVAQEVDEADKAQGTQRRVEAMLADKRREAAAPKRLNTVTCDDVDPVTIEAQVAQEQARKAQEVQERARQREAARQVEIAQAFMPPPPGLLPPQLSESFRQAMKRELERRAREMEATYGRPITLDERVRLEEAASLLEIPF